MASITIHQDLFNYEKKYKGFTRRQCRTIGNFWADLIRSTVYILLPLSLVVAVLLVSQGVVQTFS